MHTSIVIEKALQIEATNRQGVYLYFENNQWYAYEYSAYYLTALKLPVELKQKRVGENNTVVLEACLNQKYITDQLIPGVKLVQMADNMLKYHTNSSFHEFEDWKREILKNENLAS